MQAVEVKVMHLYVACRIDLANRERRARNLIVTTKSVHQPTHEGRLAATEITDQLDHLTATQHLTEFVCQRLGLLGQGSLRLPRYCCTHDPYSTRERVKGQADVAQMTLARYTTCMLQLSKSVLNRPVMSLRTGGQVATTTAAIINPNNLKIEGLYCLDAFEKKKVVVLLYQDIREIVPQGIVVDDHDSLSEPDELIRLKEIMNLRFEVLHKTVETVSKVKLGKVIDYALEIETMYIQKLYIAPSVMRNLTGGNIGVDRSQIVEITDSRIIVQDPLQGVPAGARATA